MKFVVERELRGWIEEEDRTERVASFDRFREFEDYGIYVELRSYDPERIHEEWNKFAHKRVRVTVETID